MFFLSFVFDHYDILLSHADEQFCISLTVQFIVVEKSHDFMILYLKKLSFISKLSP
jgi:hypothetical protein